MNLDDNNAGKMEESQPMAFVDLYHLSPAELAQLGVTQLAYIKPVMVQGARAFAIHAADGTPMALAADVDLAEAAIREHDMLPVRLQ